LLYQLGPQEQPKNDVGKKKAKTGKEGSTEKG
jgi:hypothetical protein